MKILANTEKGQLILSDVVACRLFGFSRLCFLREKIKTGAVLHWYGLRVYFDELEEEEK